MSTSFELFQRELNEALEIIDDGSVELNESSLLSIVNEPFDTQSLLERCDNVCNEYKTEKDQKPTIRIIHHLACSGGTLISKCISAMPNVYLLSEVHPFTNLGMGEGEPKYAPSDISSLTKYAGIPKQKELAAKIFINGIDEIHKHVTNIGGTLVLRDHTHADFNTEQVIPDKSTLVQLLEEHYDVKSVLTLRNPIDAYASLLKNGWVHFKPQTFDEYCRRLLLLIEQFKPEQIFKYEDFVKEPQIQMQAISSALYLPFDDTFEDVFSIFNVTGDSGRTSDHISKRERIAPREILEESLTSAYYKKLIDLGCC